MQRVNIFQFYRFGAAIRALIEIDGESIFSDEYSTLLVAEGALGDLLSQDQILLSGIKPATEALISKINDITSQLDVEGFDVGKKIGVAKINRLRVAFRRFETLLEAELVDRGVDVYSVSQKGIYSTSKLIESADEALPHDIRSMLTADAIQDLREAGKCLAFGANTACGFHLMRATEGIIHKYYVSVTGQIPRRKERNWGAYVRNLNRHRNNNADSKADPKLIALIDQLREHHRNVLMHPEETLTADEALSLFGVCQSAIVAFVGGLKSNTTP